MTESRNPTRIPASDSSEEKTGGKEANLFTGIEAFVMLAGAARGFYERLQKRYNAVRTFVSTVPGHEEVTQSALSEKQEDDYQVFGYLTQHEIGLSGKVRGKANEVSVNGVTVRMSARPFILLLRLIVQLKKDKSGWVNIHDLDMEGLVRRESSHQSFHRLRVAFKMDLGEAKRLIENDDHEQYRLSTHPDLVVYTKETLQTQPDQTIRRIAEELPDVCESCEGSFKAAGR